MDIHLDPDTPAPVGYVPGAGVVLVHQCETAEQRASCVICPTVTPELAALHAVQALDAAGVEHDPGETWTAVRQAVGEQLAWRQTVASLAAGELVSEPEPADRVLEPAGGHFLQPRPITGGWSGESPTVELGGWREHTSPIAPAVIPEPERTGGQRAVRVESSRHAWLRTAVVISALVVSVIGGVSYVVTSRPGFPPAGPSTGGGEGNGEGQPAEQLPADDASGAGGDDASSPGRGDASRRPSTTPTVPPTPAPAAPSSSTTFAPGNRTTTGTPPAPKPSPSSSAPSPSPSESGPADDGEQSADPEPTADPTTSSPPTCVLDLATGLCVVSDAGA